MLNSVAKYLWGSSLENEQGPATVDSQDQGAQHQDAAAEAVVAEQLATHQDDDDWVLVGLAGQDKENNCDKISSHDHHHHHHRLQHSSHHKYNHHHNHNQPNLSSCQPSQVEDSLSLSQSSFCGGNASGGAEAEVLDDAASLVHSVGCASEGSGAGIDGLDGPTNLDFDSNYSSDTESSPESVFSACSGRSHATYHPRGTSSEPWVIAPPPCFTGSQVGTLSPVAASPLENLLIEHPSMSVYLSLPSALPASHPYLSATSPTGDSALGEVRDLSPERSMETAAPSATPLVSSTTQDVSRVNSSRPPCNRPRNGGLVHHEAASVKEMARITRAAQQLQCCKSQKMITAQRCERQNKVRDIKSHPKGKSNNRRNKHEHASGAKCARYSQRV